MCNAGLLPLLICEHLKWMLELAESHLVIRDDSFRVETKMVVRNHNQVFSLVCAVSLCQCPTDQKILLIYE